jgi:copper transport protein
VTRAVLACVVVALVAPGSALAHVVLEHAEPATQSRVESPPTEIRLRFNQPVTISSGAIQVLAPDGTVLSGAARAEEDGRVVVAPVSRLVDGTAYTVRWRATGADGHSPAGVFTFGVGVAAPPPTDAVGSSGTTWRDDVARWLLFAALALLIGPLVVRVLVLRGPVGWSRRSSSWTSASRLSSSGHRTRCSFPLPICRMPTCSRSRRRRGSASPSSR